MALGLYCAALLPAGFDGIDGFDIPALPDTFCGAPKALVAPVFAPVIAGLDLNGAELAEDGFDAAGDLMAVEGLKAGAGFEAGVDFGAGAGFDAGVDLVTVEGFEAGAFDGAGRAFLDCGFGAL